MKRLIKLCCKHLPVIAVPRRWPLSTIGKYSHLNDLILCAMRLYGVVELLI